MAKTNVNTPLDEKEEKDYGRKPYYLGPSIDELPFKQAVKSGSPDGGSYAAMMSRVNYKYSKQFQLEHSQFKKPYMPEEFTEMEGLNDYLELIEYDGWELTWEEEMWPGETGGTTPGPGSCFVVCQISRGGVEEWSDDCTSLEVFFLGKETDTGDRVEVLSSTHNFSNGEGGRPHTGHYYPQSFIFTGIEAGESVVALFEQFVQERCPGAKRCLEQFTFVNQCECGIGWDPASDEEIIQNGSASIAILDVAGHGGPYNWSVAGSGYTLDNAATAGLTNTLNADGASCGTATVTVTTGDCVAAVGYIRNTTGQWVLILEDSAAQGYITGDYDSFTTPFVRSGEMLGSNQVAATIASQHGRKYTISPTKHASSICQSHGRGLSGAVRSESLRKNTMLSP